MRMLLTIFLTTTWLVYVCLKISLDGADRRILPIISIVTALGAIASFVVLLIPHDYLTAYGLQNAWRGLRICYLAVSYYGISMFVASAAVAVYGVIFEKDTDIRRMCYYLLIFSLLPIVGVTMQNINQTIRTSSPCLSLAVLYVYITMQNKKVMTDGLTGVNNRRELDAYLERRERQQEQPEWGMLMIDVDDFKKINDTIGHKLGDDALWHVAEILRSEFSAEGCFVARYGGDEFVIISRGFDKAQSEHYCKKLQKLLRDIGCTELDGRVLTISVGSAFYGESGCSKIRDIDGAC